MVIRNEAVRFFARSFIWAAHFFPEKRAEDYYFLSKYGRHLTPEDEHVLTSAKKTGVLAHL